MSEDTASPGSPDPGQEQYAYAITRRLFKYTLVGTILFSVVVVAFWYLL